jgi:predicted ester cyclase
MSEENKALVRKLNIAIEAGDADTIKSLIHTDFRHGRRGLERTLPIIMNRGQKPASAAEAFLSAGAAIQSTFDGWHAHEDLMVSEGDWVVARQTMTGKLRGKFPGSDRADPEFSFPMVVMFRFAAGQVIEIWAIGDELGFWDQMGIPFPLLDGKA